MTRTRVALPLTLLLVCPVVQGKDIVVDVDGKDVTIACTRIDREITTADKTKGGQDSATACSLLLYSLLAKNDIPGAAQLSVDPAKASEKWTKYRDAVGAEAFQKDMSAYFTSKNIVLAELVFAGDTLLVIKTQDGPRGQFYQVKDKKYLMTDKPNKALAKALNLLQEDKIKL